MELEIDGHTTGEAELDPLWRQLEQPLRLAIQCPSISSKGGLLLNREVDDIFGPIDLTVDLNRRISHAPHEHELP